MSSKLEKFQKDTDDFYFSKTKDEIIELLKLSGFEVKENGAIFDKGNEVTEQFTKYIK